MFNVFMICSFILAIVLVIIFDNTKYAMKDAFTNDFLFKEYEQNCTIICFPFYIAFRLILNLLIVNTIVWALIVIAFFLSIFVLVWYAKFYSLIFKSLFLKDVDWSNLQIYKWSNK